MTPILPLDRTAPDFRAKVDTLFEVQLPIFTEEATVLEAKLDSAIGLEIAAADSADRAEAAAQAATQTAGAVKWVSGANYGEGVVVWSPLKPGQSYRRITAGSGSLDPSVDRTSWAQIGLNRAAIHAAMLSL